MIKNYYTTHSSVNRSDVIAFQTCEAVINSFFLSREARNENDNETQVPVVFVLF
jgi:hypothetical protein